MWETKILQEILRDKSKVLLWSDVINPWRLYPQEHSRIWHRTSPPSQRFRLCAGPEHVIVTISQHTLISLVFRNWHCGEEVAGEVWDQDVVEQIWN